MKKRLFFLAATMLGAGVAYAAEPDKTQSLGLSQTLTAENYISAKWTPAQSEFENSLAENEKLGTITLTLDRPMNSMKVGVSTENYEGKGRSDVCKGYMKDAAGKGFKVKFDGYYSDVNWPVCAAGYNSMGTSMTYTMRLYNLDTVTVDGGKYTMIITPMVYL